MKKDPNKRRTRIKKVNKMSKDELVTLLKKLKSNKETNSLRYKHAFARLNAMEVNDD